MDFLAHPIDYAAIINKLQTLATYSNRGLTHILFSIYTRCRSVTCSMLHDFNPKADKVLIISHIMITMANGNRTLEGHTLCVTDWMCHSLILFPSLWSEQVIWPHSTTKAPCVIPKIPPPQGYSGS